MLDKQRRRITVEQYFAEVGATEERVELIDGEAWLMTGGTRRHAGIAGQIFGTLFARLRGTGCRPFGSDMAVRLDDYNFRFPDVAIYCDLRDLGPEAADHRTLRFPKVIFEVLSPSTARIDRFRKIAEYKELASVAAVVLVDPAAHTIELHERTGPAAWTQREVGGGEALVLTDPHVTLTAAEIFGDA